MDVTFETNMETALVRSVLNNVGGLNLIPCSISGWVTSENNKSWVCT